MYQKLAKAFALGIAVAAVLAGSPAGAAGMTEKQIFSESVRVAVPLDLPVISIQGRQNDTDRRLYDVTVATRGTADRTVSVFTGGNLQAPFRVDLLSSSAIATDVQVGMRYLYDARRPVCVIGVDGTCAARLGFDPTDARSLIGTPRVSRGNINAGDAPWDWELPEVEYDLGSAEQAQLIVDVRLTAPTGASEARTVRIPFLGQVAHTVPS